MNKIKFISLEERILEYIQPHRNAIILSLRDVGIKWEKIAFELLSNEKFSLSLKNVFEVKKNSF